VEHLALAFGGSVDHAFNGSVDSTTTNFYATGTAEEVGEFLGHVCRSLDDLPMNRLTVEKRILRTEAGRRDPSAYSRLATTRLGAQSVGSVSYPEYALDKVTAPDVEEWRRRHFTRDNAVLWVVGEPPRGLAVPLPQGAYMPCPPVPAPVVPVPGYLVDNSAGIGLSGLTPRSASAVMTRAVLQGALTDLLRHDRGLSYSITAATEAWGPDIEHTLLWADALQEHAQDVARTVVDVLARLCSQGSREQELETAHRNRARALADPQRVYGLAWGAAMRALYRLPPSTPAERDAEYAAVDDASVREAARQLMDTSLLLVPPGVAVEAPFLPVPSWSDVRVSGRTFAPTPHNSGRLHVDDNGVTYETAEGRAVTVHYRQCAAALAWNDGTRVLIGTDGFVVRIAPELWKHGSQLPSVVDPHLPASLVVPMGDRDDLPTAPDAPLPVSSPAAGRGAALSRRTKRWLTGLAWFFALPQLLVLMGELTGTVPLGERPEAASVPGLAVMAAVLTSLAVLGTVSLLRDRRRS
jgi:predicted Zn-dependent peptidase